MTELLTLCHAKVGGDKSISVPPGENVGGTCLPVPSVPPPGFALMVECEDPVKDEKDCRISPVLFHSLCVIK